MNSKIFLVAVIFAFLCLAGCKGGGGGGSGSSASSSSFESLLGDDLGSDLDQVLGDIEDTGDNQDSDQEPPEELVELPDPDVVDPDLNINPEPSTILMFGISILSFLGYKIKKLRG